MEHLPTHSKVTGYCDITNKMLSYNAEGPRKALC